MPGSKQILLHLTEDAVAAMDRAAKERGMTRSNFVQYVMTAFGAGTVLMSDPTTWKAWKDYQDELLEHTARVIARQEARLVLEEEGFTTSRFTL